ncbi:MAG: hypothetical protein C0625_16440 [Arcobacter sp.]|nr:MAG: hypothetical protein C0625_16440 [Arcobacter sp.]
MLIDTDSIIHSEFIKVKVVFKNGKTFQTKLNSKDIKSIEFEIKEKDYRSSIWQENKSNRTK